MMRLFRKSEDKPSLILVAARSPEALSLAHAGGFRVREAWSTHGVLDALAEEMALVILDPEDLTEATELATQVLQAALEAARQEGLPVVSPAQFLADSQRFLSAPVPPGGSGFKMRFLPSRVALFTNYAGGTGKTTLALCAARHFQRTSRQPCALLEMGLGGSAIQARLGERLLSLYSLVTQDRPPSRWEGVDVYPLHGREAQVLASDERLWDALQRIACAHTLTVLDAFPGSPLWRAALSLATDIFVIAAPRPDALAQTEALLHEIDEGSQALESRPRLHLVLNMVRSLGERLQLGDREAVNLPFDAGKAARLDASLAAPLLGRLYPGWRAAGRGGHA